MNLNCLSECSLDFLVNIKFNWTNLLLETCQERCKTSAKSRKILWYPVLHAGHFERKESMACWQLSSVPSFTPWMNCFTKPWACSGSIRRKVFGVCYVTAKLMKGFWCQVEPEDRVEFQRLLLLYFKVLHFQEYESLYRTRQENIRINYQFPFLHVGKQWSLMWRMFYSQSKTTQTKAEESTGSLGPECFYIGCVNRGQCHLHIERDCSRGSARCVLKKTNYLLVEIEEASGRGCLSGTQEPEQRGCRVRHYAAGQCSVLLLR